MAFISFIVKDVIETFNMHRWLYLFQGSQDHEKLKFVSLAYMVPHSPPNSPPASPRTDGGEDEASNGTEQHDRDCDAPGDAPGHEQRPDGETEVTMKRKLCRPLTGITKWERAACQPNWPRCVKCEADA